MCSTNAEATTGPFTESLPAALEKDCTCKAATELEKEFVYSINLVITIKKRLNRRVEKENQDTVTESKTKD